MVAVSRQGQAQAFSSPSFDRTVRIGRRIRELRIAAGETLATLARKSGISASTLSKIENDKVSPTFVSLVRLAAALGMQLNDLIGARAGAIPANARLAVTRREEVKFTRTTGAELGPLCIDVVNKQMNPLLNRIDPGGASTDRLVRHEGEEFALVLEGRIEIQTEHYRPVRLDKGDSAYFDSQMAHRYVAIGDEPAEVLIVWLSPQPISSEETMAFATRLFNEETAAKE